MIDVICHCRDWNAFASWRWFAGAGRRPSRREHPVIASTADDASAVDHNLQLLVGELALPRDERSAVLVTGENRSLKRPDDVAEGCVAQVSHVQNHAQSFEFDQH